MKYIIILCTALGLLATGPGLSAQQTPARPATGTSSGDVVNLPSFEVNANTDKGYLAANSVSATRISTPIADLPFAVSAFTQQFITDIGARELTDIVTYAAGVSNGSAGFNAGETFFYIRGFQQTPEQNGFFENRHANQYADSANIERVEVVKGPASLLYGSIAPGGTVNFITKQPQTKRFTTFKAEAGSYEYWRGTIDVNQPLVGNKLLFRFNGAYENGQQYTKPSAQYTYVVAPAITWNPTSTVSLKVSYNGFSRHENPPAFLHPQIEVGSPATMVNTINNPVHPGPSALLSGKTGIDAAQGFPSNGSDPGFLEFYPGLPYRETFLSNHDWRHDVYGTGTAELAVTLGAHWKARANLDINHAFQNYIQSESGRVYLAPTDSLVYSGGTWAVSPYWNSLTAAQQIDAGLTFAHQILASKKAAFQLQNGTQAPAIVNAQPMYAEAKTNDWSTQAEIAGDYTFTWGKVKPLIGLFWDASKENNRGATTFANAASPNYHYWDLNPASPTYFIDRSNFTTFAQLVNMTGNTLAFQSDQAIYGVLNSSFFNDRLYVVAGARYTRSAEQSTNFLAAAGTNPVGRGYRVGYTTPQLGIGYKVTKDLMLYASYSTADQLPTSAFLQTIQLVNGIPASVPTTPAKVLTGTGYEAGVKTNFLDGRISSTFSVYQIKQENLVQGVGQIINGNTLNVSVQETEITANGVELEMTISPTDNFQVFLSASECDARNTREPPGYAYYLGEHPAYSPKTLANLWARYNFKGGLKGLWIGGGEKYQGKTAQDTANAEAYLHSYLLWNAAIGYDWMWEKHPVSAKLAGQNLADTPYTFSTQTRGAPRMITASTTITF